MAAESSRSGCWVRLAFWGEGLLGGGCMAALLSLPPSAGVSEEGRAVRGVFWEGPGKPSSSCHLRLNDPLCLSPVTLGTPAEELELTQ